MRIERGGEEGGQGGGRGGEGVVDREKGVGLKESFLTVR